ncbi:nucleotidyltransferase domain-containing protein [Rapidithrix thailandica]|uniref:Nucleotidyltransferase domain-containing protein n=1 Tax=Rapidithrix thailandica TaxID=413964 RepID=A0AAW9SCP6_9BACT
MTIEELRERGLVIFECLSGSKAYGLDLPTSDVDLKGVYILPEEQFFGFDYIGQVNDASNDTVFYELKRFLELLMKSNPNLLEMLNVSEEHILYKHPVFDQIKEVNFLSKLCKKTFANYAISQVKKARGLNKKIMNPMPEERKTILEFCYIAGEGKSMELRAWLHKNALNQEQCGLVNIQHMPFLYALYYDERQELGFRGIMQKTAANEVALSSVPKSLQPLAYLYFNKDGYTCYCKEYKEYWAWVKKRNEARYQGTLEHGKNYDAKNMMHTFRLLDMAEEVLSSGIVIVKRPNREELLNIRSGCYEYEELLEMAEEKVQRIEALEKESTLPDVPDKVEIEKLLIKVRKDWYAQRE